MRDELRRRAAESSRKTQFYAMLGSRSIWHEGWKAVTTHPVIAGWSNFNDDEWELYHTDVDRSELHNLAAEQPGQAARARQPLVLARRARTGVPAGRPLAGRDLRDAAAAAHRSPGRVPLLPRTPRPVPEWQAVNMKNRSFAIGALVDIPGAGRRGRALRPRHAFRRARALRQGRPAALRQQLRRRRGADDRRRPRTSRPATNLILSASFEKEGQEPTHAFGTLTLYHGEHKVGEGEIKTQLGAFAIAGSGLYVGRHVGRARHRRLSRRRRRTRSPAGRSTASRSTSAASPIIDLERHAAMLLEAQ